MPVINFYECTLVTVQQCASCGLLLSVEGLVLDKYAWRIWHPSWQNAVLDMNFKLE